MQIPSPTADLATTWAFLEEGEDVLYRLTRFIDVRIHRSYLT